MGNGGMAPIVVSFDTKWRPVISLTPRPLYSVGTKPTVLIEWEPGVGLKAGIV